MEVMPPSAAEMDPSNEDESILVGMLFDRVTEVFPEWPMGDRSDLAMKMFAVVKKWAHNLELTNDSSRTVVYTEPVDELVNGLTTSQLFNQE